MVYKCEACNSLFSDPRVHVDDGGDEYGKYTVSCCPYCGDEYIERQTPCPCCGMWKDTGEYLCTNCRTKLKVKFRKFRDHLINAELEELDDLLDGTSVREI